MRASSLALLVCLSLGASAITDCELCKVITEIYGGCSPELLANYVNKTGIKDVEWKCLNDFYVPPPENATYEVTPIHTISLMNYTISIYSNEKNVFIYPSHNFNEWGYWLDNDNNYYYWINFNLSQKTYIEIQSFGLSRNNTKFGNSTFFLEFLNSTAITSISTKPTGYTLNLTMASKTGFYNFTGKIGKLDACTPACSVPGDGIYVTTYCSGCENVLIMNKFTYMAGVWDDYYRSCSVAGCTLCPRSNQDGAYATIPITNYAKPIDTNGSSTNNCKSSPVRGTVYYVYPQCHQVSSGKSVMEQLSIWTGGTFSFSCVAPPSPSGSNVTAQNDDDEDIKKPQFPYYYALVPLGVLTLGYGYMRRKNAA